MLHCQTAHLTDRHPERLGDCSRAVQDVIGLRPANRDRGDLAALPFGPAAEHFGLWLADAVLAQQLGWVRPLPLLAAGLSDPALRGRLPGRRPRPGDPAWLDACHLAYAHAAARAHDLARELDRRAHVLLTAAPRLRAKQAPKIVAALLADDAVTASSRLAGMTDRSLRRLLERLVALGALRELTGRATSRLYGL